MDGAAPRSGVLRAEGRVCDGCDGCDGCGTPLGRVVVGAGPAT